MTVGTARRRSKPFNADDPSWQKDFERYAEWRQRLTQIAEHKAKSDPLLELVWAIGFDGPGFHVVNGRDEFDYTSRIREIECLDCGAHVGWKVDARLRHFMFHLRMEGLA
jgi:hypothetical protein